MTISTIRSRITGFARTALAAATRKKPPISELRSPNSGSPLALASIIRPQVRERWLLPQVGAITPQYIEMTLRGALAGAHLPQWELFNLMEDTWPRLRKNVLELKMAVRNRRAVFEAYRDEDEQESPAATERMKLVSAALRTMQPDPAADEGAFDDMVGDILDAWFKGVSVLEIDWRLAQTRQLGRFVAPRCARWASPVNYAWDNNLRLGLADEMQQTLTPFPADRVIVAKCKTKSGSILGGALLRPLVWWWCAANFSADWLLNLAQVFGLPFRWATYEPAAAQETVDRICNMLQNMGSAGWAAFPAGTSLELKAEGTKSGAQTPQGDMLDRADKQCDLLVLGQTLTTDTGGMGAGGGSRALGQVHADVRAGIIDAAAKFAASVIEQQLIPAILRLNYGDTDEAPTLSFHERGDDDLGARAQWIATLSNAGAGKIIPLDWLAKTFGIPKPEAGEMTLGQAKQEEQAARSAPRDNETARPSDNGTLAAGEPRHAVIEDEALEAGFWKEELHPRSKGGLFTNKPAMPTSSGAGGAAAAIKPVFAPTNPKPEQPFKPALTLGGVPINLSDLSPSAAYKPAATPKKLLNGQQLLDAMRPHIEKLHELDALKKEADSLTKQRFAFIPDGKNRAQYAELYAKNVSAIRKANQLEEQIIANGRKLVTLPKAYRGTVPVVGTIEPEIREAVQGGRKIVSSYVHAKLLPPTTFVAMSYENRRAFHIPGHAFLSPIHDEMSAAHEIVHGIELKHPAVLQKSRDFLTKRVAGEKPVKLKDLNPNGQYEDHEKAYEDRWKEFGGSVYSGADYSNDENPQHAPATELLSEGIERLHANPALFADNDPEYFTFVTNTLRNL